MALCSCPNVLAANCGRATGIGGVWVLDLGVEISIKTCYVLSTGKTKPSWCLSPLKEKKWGQSNLAKATSKASSVLILYSYRHNYPISLLPAVGEIGIPHIIGYSVHWVSESTPRTEPWSVQSFLHSADIRATLWDRSHVGPHYEFVDAAWKPWCLCKL